MQRDLTKPSIYINVSNQLIRSFAMISRTSNFNQNGHFDWKQSRGHYATHVSQDVLVKDIFAKEDILSGLPLRWLKGPK
jgi:hypothetical protein